MVEADARGVDRGAPQHLLLSHAAGMVPGMDDLLNDIETAVASGSWTLALIGTLALPDICAALEHKSGRTDSERYQRWWERNLGPTYPLLDAQELWQLRNSMIHQGRSSGRRYERLVFVRAGSGMVLHNNVFNGALNLDLPTFCADVMNAVQRWRAALAGTDDYERHAEHLLRWHPDGLAPYVVGVPVLS